MGQGDHQGGRGEGGKAGKLPQAQHRQPVAIELARAVAEWLLLHQEAGAGQQEA